MRTVVFTSDNHSWLLKGFFHQWEKYGKTVTEERDSEGLVNWHDNALKIEVAGFTKPASLPSDVSFVSIGKFEDYPVTRWSDAIIKYLDGIDDELVLFLLEDYWLMREVNSRGIAAAQGYMQVHRDVARFDVAADRMFAKNAQYTESWGLLDICECKGDYSLSFQASIYRREYLLDIMRPGETPWQAELKGSARLNMMSSLRVVGSYQWPINYMIVMNKGQLDMKGDWMFPARTLAKTDWDELSYLGCLQPEALHE